MSSPVVSIGRLAAKDLLNSMSRIMEEASDAVSVCTDVKLACRDGAVMWNRFVQHMACQNRPSEF